MADQDIDAANMRRRINDAIRVRPPQKLPPPPCRLDPEFAPDVAGYRFSRAERVAVTVLPYSGLTSFRGSGILLPHAECGIKTIECFPTTVCI
jgi:hypothetical protein